MLYSDDTEYFAATRLFRRRPSSKFMALNGISAFLMRIAWPMSTMQHCWKKKNQCRRIIWGRIWCYNKSYIRMLSYYSKTSLIAYLTYCITSLIAYKIRPRPRSLLKIIKLKGLCNLTYCTSKFDDQIFFNLPDIDFHWSISSAVAL